MFYIPIEGFTSILAIVTLLIFFHNAFTTRKDIPLFLFLLGFIAQEIGTYLLTVFFPTFSTLSTYFTTAYTTATTFLLTYYYVSEFRHRILVTLTYLLIIFISEYLSVPIYCKLSKVQPDYNNENTISIILLIANFISFLLVILSGLYFQKKRTFFSLKYTLLVFTIPVISILIGIPLLSPFTTENEFETSRTLVLGGLILSNVMNYYLLNYVWKTRILENEQELLKQQLDFQTEKYQQISSTYRNTRSFLHDTKKHFFYLQGCIENKRYTEMTDYLKTAITGLESTYNRINTGNLAIDSLVSNQLIMAEQLGIRFDTDIQVDSSKIPIEDYDLCIILGNLLDNSMHECQRILPPRPRYIEVELYTSSLEFIIHITNALNKDENARLQNKSKESLLHGYGLQNIQNLMPKYSGSFSYFREDSYFETIVVLPIKDTATSL